MRCFNCSAEMTDNSDSCPKCGAKQGFSKNLIKKAKNNDQFAITELYSKTYSNVYYTIKALIKDEDAALDILQDTYIKAFKSLDQLESAEKFRPWVKRIAHNRAIDYLRQNKPVLFSEMENEDSDTPIDFEDTREENLPEAMIDREETTRLIREILNSIPEEQRVVISLFYYEQLSVKEIAKELSISENTVKSRLNYGRKKIETKVLALEKKGTKLYGLAPVPFLLLLFKTQNAQHAPVFPSVSANVLSSCTQTATATSAAGAGAATAASTGIIGTLKTSLTAKIVAGILAITVIGGASTGVASVMEEMSANDVAVAASKQSKTPAQNATGPTALSDEPSTIAPTFAPTAAAVDAPIGTPIGQPTEVSAIAPTAANIGTPTQAPVGEPINAPTQAPVREPNNSPTAPPTEAPIDSKPQKPTEAPSSSVYTDPNGAFRITLPGIWSEHGIIDTEYIGGDYGLYTVNLYSAYTYGYQKNGGHVLSFDVYDNPDPVWSSNTESFTPDSSALVNTADYYITWSDLLDVNDIQDLLYFPPEYELYAEELSEYNALHDTIDEIIASFEFLK